ncbi:hypothetical protein FACS1894111_05200 [Clostridia bacterium]|nr:hypothetical protein FACS1894111_05200 [Clostridia bacterium]
MNILFYRYGSICEPDVIEGFLELGNSVSEITAEITNKSLLPSETLHLVREELDKNPYDFVFSINFFPVLADICNIYHIRYLCQTVDSPVMELFSSSIEKEWNRIFLFDGAQYREFSSKNPEHIFHLPLATNVARWDRVISATSHSKAQRFCHDISFVGSLYTEKSPYDRLKGASEYLKGYLSGIMDAQLKIYGASFLEEVLPDSIVAEFREHLPGFYTPPESFLRNDRAAMVRCYLEPKISAMERVEILGRIGEQYPLDLYTGSDTKMFSKKNPDTGSDTKVFSEKNPDTGSDSKVFSKKSSDTKIRNRGLAKSLTEMPLIFHHSKINLNITTKSIREGLPQRIFDVLGCGGFLITNYQAELADCFTVGEDLEMYTSSEELLDKIGYYLSHEKEREAIARNGYEKVKRNHNYPVNLLRMMSLAYGVE